MQVSGRLGRRILIVASLVGVWLSGESCLPMLRPPPAPDRTHLAFYDDFTETGLNLAKWGTCYPWFRGSGCTNQGNAELEWYTPRQVTLEAGVLRLKAIHDPIRVDLGSKGTSVLPYQSGMVTTARRFSFQYGFTEITARVTAGAGLWPTLWLLPIDGSWPPEVDFMEAYGGDPSRLLLTYHRNGLGPSQEQAAINLPGGISRWHTYGLDWRQDSLVWYVDGKPRFRVVGDSPNQPMYLLANLAVSGASGRGPNRTTPAVGTMEISKVEVWV